MSKIRDLRRQAQQELRAHRFDKAVALYEKICESEKSNAGYRNELGDIYLKMGELPQAVQYFREAASLYRDVGLTNNAVAILKKVLRQDPHHFESLWELGEIRSEQGLETEAVRSFLDYLRTADAVPESGRESFLRRSAEVLDRWGQEPEVLAELDNLFERWGADQERAQVLVAKAALARSEGEHDIAEKYIEHAHQAFPELEVLPAYSAYLAGDGPGELPTGPVPVVDEEDVVPEAATEEERVELDEGSLDLGFDFDEDLSGPVESAGDSYGAPAPEDDDAPASSEVEIPADASSIDPQALDLGGPADDPQDSAPTTPVEAPPEASGPVEPVDDVSGPAAPVDEHEEFSGPATPVDEHEEFSGRAAPVDEPEKASGPTSPVDEANEDPSPVADPEESAASRASVDLLDEILSDGDVDFASQDRSQIDTIASEVEGQMAGNVDPSDHAGQYDLGMVYADMGLVEQAVGAFLRAAESESFRLRALEMAGGCRLESGDYDEAIHLLQQGLEVRGHSETAYVGLLYFLGRAHEARGERDLAIESFERVTVIDASFKDVTERLRSLHDQPAQL